MPRTPTTPAQISGHRFLVRRVEHALIRADSRMLHDPIRTRNRAMLIGIVLVVLMLAGTVIVEFIRPRGGSADGQDLVMVKSTGGLYVRQDQTWHPVANLASARLILGRAEQPKLVKSGALPTDSLGYPLGIAGAPEIDAVGSDVDSKNAQFGICERSDSALHEPVKVRETAVVVRFDEAGDGDGTGDGDEAGDAVDGSPGESNAQPVIFEAVDRHGQAQWWLIFRGTRMFIDRDDDRVVQALNLWAVQPRPVSTALLNAFPEAAPVQPPEVPEWDAQTSFPVPFDRVGTVVSSDNGMERTTYVVTLEGLAELTPVETELFGGTEAVLDQKRISTVPKVQSLTLPAERNLPNQIPQWDAAAVGWICAYRSEASGKAQLTVGQPTGIVTRYVDSDGSGDAVDHYVASEFGALAVAVTGGVHVISATGVRHVVDGFAGAQALGFDSVVDAPWEVVSALPEGTALTQSEALRPLAGTAEQSRQ